MQLKVFYKAIDPYYSDCNQVFIGPDDESCWNQKYEFEQWLGREHPAGIRFIYEPQVIDDEMSEWL